MQQRLLIRRRPTVDPAQGDKIRKRAGRFRVLIIGRANSGKTTILRQVCRSAEDPEIYGVDGHTVIDMSVLKPNIGVRDHPPLFKLALKGTKRGLHDIEHEMIFKSNPNFIFHDSRGFEAGNRAELNYVKQFLAKRAQQRRLRDRVHAIWYCIPLNDSRPVTAAEKAFFAECGTGHVPVIVLFSKLDALDDRSFQMLEQENPDMSYEDTHAQTPIRSQQIFDNMFHDGLKPLFVSKYPPKGYVALRDMDKQGADCSRLLEVTVDALDDERLQLLFIATQQQSLKMCTSYSIGYLDDNFAPP